MHSKFHDWYDKILHLISSDVTRFYSHFFPSRYRLESIGKDFRLNHCPFCEHHDCFTVTPNITGVQCFSTGCEGQGNHIAILVKYYVKNRKSEGE